MLAALILVGLLSSAGLAGASVIGSKHDFTVTNGGTFMFNTDQVCIFCHTPHGSVSKDRLGNAVPLWNRSLNEGAAGFNMYTSSTFKGIMPADNKPTGNSLLCLSCHDGVSSIGGVINSGGTPITAVPPSPNTIGDAALTYPSYANINIGRDLTNDHPVSFPYDATLLGKDASLKDPSTISPLKLYNGNLECCTCHDPHEYGSTTGKAPFLRMSNANSALCTQCHNK